MSTENEKQKQIRVESDGIDKSTKKKDELEEELIAWRRRQVWELLAEGLSQSEIAKKLIVSDATIHRDVQHIKDEASAKQEAISKEFSFEQHKALQGISLAIKNLWTIADDEKRPTSERMQALAMIIRAYDSRLNVAAGKNVAKILKGEESILELIKEQRDIAVSEANRTLNKLNEEKEKNHILEFKAHNMDNRLKELEGRQS